MLQEQVHVHEMLINNNNNNNNNNNKFNTYKVHILIYMCSYACKQIKKYFKYT